MCFKANMFNFDTPFRACATGVYSHSMFSASAADVVLSKLVT